MGRDFEAVVADVIGNIPKEQTDLRSAIESLLDSARYRAPEQMHLSWLGLEEVLTDAIGGPSETWHWTIVEIITGKKRGGP